MRWSDVTAFFGGTFDPPHLGHREALEGLLREPGVGRAMALIAAVPPQKAGAATTEQRIEMARLAFGAERVDLRELERARRDPARPSYTFDTLQEIAREIPRERLAFVIGADQLERLPTWHRFPELLDCANWVVLARKPAGDDLARKTLREWLSSGLARTPSDPRENDGSTFQLAQGRRLKLVSTSAREMSSSSIRQTLARSGQPPENSLDPVVAAYLKLHRIYGTSDAHDV